MDVGVRERFRDSVEVLGWIRVPCDRIGDSMTDAGATKAPGGEVAPEPPTSPCARRNSIVEEKDEDAEEEERVNALLAAGAEEEVRVPSVGSFVRSARACEARASV